MCVGAGAGRGGLLLMGVCFQWVLDQFVCYSGHDGEFTPVPRAKGYVLVAPDYGSGVYGNIREKESARRCTTGAGK